MPGALLLQPPCSVPIPKEGAKGNSYLRVEAGNVPKQIFISILRRLAPYIKSCLGDFSILS